MAAPGIYAAGRFWINRIAGIFYSPGFGGPKRQETTLFIELK
jgi:hypothetical protein